MMNSLPNHPQAGFNKEKLQNLVQRVRFLQSQGAKEETHPEYAQIMNFLKNLQRQQVRIPDLSPVPAVPAVPSQPTGIYIINRSKFNNVH